jgi:hypothetical protein
MRKDWRIFLALMGLLIVGDLAGFVIWPSYTLRLT